MPQIMFQGQTYSCAESETILECLTRQGQVISSSCRSGVCQTCLMRATQGAPPTSAQQGLKDTLRAQGYFLSCVCVPETALEVALPGEEVAFHTEARVVSKQRLNHDILLLTLQCHKPFAYRAGQFVQLYREDGLIRSYSLANLPDADGLLELHVRRLPNGAMSGWLHDTVREGDTLKVVGPAGNCFYLPDRPEGGLLLIGTGSGLAPLWGIVQDALSQGHRGPIHLFHGSWEPSGLYLMDELRALAAQNPNFAYTPCVDAAATPELTLGRGDQVALATLPNLKGWRVFLCGHPEIVKIARKKAFLAGAAMQDIYADPFVLSKPPAQDTSSIARTA